MSSNHLKHLAAPGLIADGVLMGLLDHSFLGLDFIFGELDALLGVPNLISQFLYVLFFLLYHF